MVHLAHFFLLHLLFESYGNKFATGSKIESKGCGYHNVALVLDSTKLVTERAFERGDGFLKYTSTLLDELKASGVKATMSGRVYHQNVNCSREGGLNETENFGPTYKNDMIRAALGKFQYFKSLDVFQSTCAEEHLFSQYKGFTKEVKVGMKKVGMIVEKDGAKYVAKYKVHIYEEKLKRSSISVDLYNKTFDAQVKDIVKKMKPTCDSHSSSISPSISSTVLYPTSSFILVIQSSSQSHTSSSISPTGVIVATESTVTLSPEVRTSIMPSTTQVISSTSICPSPPKTTPGQTHVLKTTESTTELLNKDIEKFMERRMDQIAKNDTKVKEFMKDGMGLLTRIDSLTVSIEPFTNKSVELVKYLKKSLIEIGKLRDAGSISYNETDVHEHEHGILVSTQTKPASDIHYEDKKHNSISLLFPSKGVVAGTQKRVVAIMEYPTLPIMLKLKLRKGEMEVSDTSFIAVKDGDRIDHHSKLSYSLHMDKENGRAYKCVSWDTGSNGTWNHTQCYFLGMTGTKVNCRCNYHDTLSLAVMAVKADPEHKDRFSLHLATYIGCAVAGGVCVLILLIFILFKRTLRYDQNIVHFNLALSIAVSNGLFVAADFAFKIKYLCMGVSIAIMYFYLATLFWILVESFHLYMLVVRRSKDTNMAMFYMIIGWVVPSIIVALTAALEKEYFLRKEFCWLMYDSWRIWTLVGPSVLLISVSVVLLAYTFASTFKVERTLPGVLKFQRIAQLLFILIPFLGISWSLSLFAVNEKKMIFQYALTGVNGLLGLLAITSLCCLSSGVKEGITPKKKSMQSIGSNSSMGKDNKGNDSSMLSLSVITEPAFHSKTNF